MAQLSKHGLETLWEDGDFILSRSTLADEPAPVLVLAPASERPAPGIIARLEHAYALRGELEPSSVARPLRLVHCGGLPALLLEDPRRNLLARAPRSLFRFPLPPGQVPALPRAITVKLPYMAP